MIAPGGVVSVECARMDDLLREFLVETGESLDNFDVQLVRFEHEPGNLDVLRSLFRLVHTIKGTCGFLGLPRLEALSHAAEDLLGRFRDGAPVTRDAVTLILASVDRIKAILASLDKTAAEPPGSDSDLIRSLEEIANRMDRDGADAPAMDVSAPASPAIVDEAPASASTLRVNVDTLEQLLGMVSELVLTRNQLLEISRQQNGHAFASPLQRLSQVTSQLQDCVMRTRMQPIDTAWQKLPRLVRDLALELDKDIGLELSGAETELDRQVLDLIKDPLTHLVRNAADHGLESRSEREAAGKPARGSIVLRAYHVGGSIIIEVSDDGRGLNLQRIREKALERGLVSETERDRLTDDEIAKFIFHPGFSTASTITAISGRGVGLDVVHANVERIGGSIDIQTQPGRGVTFILSLPLTLAIVPALLVGAAGEQFAIPQSAVVELAHVDGEGQARIDRIEGGRVLIMRGEMLPLISLRAGLRLPEAPGDLMTGYVVILSVRGGRFGVLVDRVFHTEEIVVKPLSSLLRHVHVYSGNTVLGDGSVVLILDPTGLARTTNVLALGTKRLVKGNTPADVAPLSMNNKTALLVFRFGGRRCVLPLSAIARLEEVEERKIERAAGAPVIQYRGKLLPLAGSLPPAGFVKSPCLILAHQEYAVGLIVEAIIDVIEQQLALDRGAADGLLGAAIVNGESMDVLDALHILRAAHPALGHRKDKVSRSALVLESQAFFRDMIVPVLRAADFNVVTLSSPDDLAGSRLGRFDAIVADPAVIGFVSGEMRGKLGSWINPNAPVIAWCDDFDSLRCNDWSALGYDGAVSKFDRLELLALLNELAAAPLREAA